MTFSALQANSVNEEPDVYVSKADEDEAEQWDELTGGADGNEHGESEYSDDLRELGLRIT